LFIRCPHQKKERDGLDKHVILNIIQYLKDKKLMNAYIISLGLQVWWGLVYIYMPLFIISHGLSEGFVSVFFALIIIPLILIEYRVSRLSEKYGFRHFFRYGFLLLAIMGFVLFLVENIYIQIGIVIVASFFAGFIEPLFESYFFTIVKKVDEEKYYPLFSTAIDVGGILGKAFPAIGLLFLPEKYAFVIIGILMLCFYIYVKRIKEVVPPFRHIPSILDYTKLPHRR
jgi:MFS family permease